MNSISKIQVSLSISLLLLAGGVVGLRFHNDFLAGFGICGGVAVIAISTLKRYRASFT